MQKQKPLTGRVLVVIHSDQHVGSDIGLAPSKWYIKSESGDLRELSPSPAQVPIYDHWESSWKRMYNKKFPIVGINNGDNIQGNDGKFFGLWTHDLQEQADIAAQLFKPKRDKCVRWYSTRGTERHVGGMGRWDEYIAKELGSDTTWGTFSTYHLEVEISGVSFNVAHHGIRSGKYLHTMENQARTFAKDICLRKLSRRERPPDVIVASHVHQKIHEVVNIYDHKCHVIVTPSFQAKSEFAHKVLRQEDLSDIGLAFLEIENGKILDIDFDCMRLPSTRRVIA